MACLGLGVSETPREFAFCHYALFSEEPLIVEDAQKDARFVENPLVVGEPYIRFYAGAPLIMPSGRILGTFCIIDEKPRSLSAIEIGRLRQFAAAARDIISGLSPSIDQLQEEDGERHFLARLVHDLRTPIGNMMGFAELMQHEVHGPLGDSKYAEYVDIFRQSGSHALELINGILSIEKTKSRSTGVVEQFNLTHLARTVVRSFEGQAKGRRQEITLVAPTRDIECNADELAVHRILNNLVSNSCKYAGDGSSIKIELVNSYEGKLYSIAVIDDGPGLSGFVLDNLGKPFIDTRGDDGLSGLGLSNVLKHAAAMGWVCDIANRKSGGVRAEFYKPSSQTR
jgi:two-component system, sensor histidine kinase